jgi:maltose alpha-D-glucosyltransferase/alpha-amylase
MRAHATPRWLEDAVFYQIYPQSFYDANGDGIGDIPGIIRKLDYLSELGVNAVWLNPCFVSPFQDAGYDVADYYRVAPRYGTNRDLVRLFEQARRRGIRICLDLVPGHTSIEHPWFQASCRHRRNRYSDRYIWTRSVWDPGAPPLRFVNGYAERDGAYAINFFYCQPALNYGFARPDPRCPWQQPTDAPGPRAARAEIRRIMDFWLRKGAAGFRVDMASSLVKSDPGCDKTTLLWQEIRDWLDRRHPEAALIAEWGNPSQSIGAGFHVDFMLHVGVPGLPSLFFKGRNRHCFFDARGGGTISEFLGEYTRQQRNTPGGYISVPSANHDMPRPGWGRSQADLEVIMAFLLTWPGVPFLYYGDEIGMRFLPGLPSKEGGYGRTGSRTPMQWDGSRNAGFSSAPARKLYLPIDPQARRPTVQSQACDPRSLLSHVRRLIALRRHSPALGAKGKMTPVFAEPGRYPFVYLRERRGERFLVALNPPRRPVAVRLDAAALGEMRPELARGVAVSSRAGRSRISMAGASYGIFRLG